MEEKASAIRVSSKLDNLSIIRGFIRLTGNALGADREAVADLVMAADEAATNIMRHGYGGDSGTIEVTLQREGNMLVLTLRDKAPEFDPLSVEPPDLTVPLEERPLGGLGVHFIRESVDEVEYQPNPGGGNLLILKKAINS